MQPVRLLIAVCSLVGSAAWAQQMNSGRPQNAEQGTLISLHSGLCLGGGAQRPAAEPCNGTHAISVLPLLDKSALFMLRREQTNQCLHASRDSRFGWFTCTPALANQHWSWLPLPSAEPRARMLRSHQLGQCVFSNADGRFGLYQCNSAYADQHWRLGPVPYPPVPVTTLNLLGDWYWNDGAATAVHGDGTFVTPNDGGGTWRPLGHGEFELRWGSGRIDRVRLLPNGLTLEGVGKLAGAEHRLSAMRQKLSPYPTAPALPDRPLPLCSPVLTPAPAPPAYALPPGPPAGDPYSCQTAADCTIFCPSVPGCCGSACGCTHAIRRDHVAAYEAEYKKTCRHPPSCLAEGCARREARSADCRNNRCAPAMIY